MPLSRDAVCCVTVAGTLPVAGVGARPPWWMGFAMSGSRFPVTCR